MNKVRYGIISTASIVPRFCRGMELTGSGEVTAISSRDRAKAEKTAAALNIPNAYDDHRRILEDPGIDAVYLPLVNSLHYPFAKEALLAGKHVVMEKPFVLHASEAEELFALAEEKHLFLTEAVKTPHLPLYGKVKEVISSGIYGEIRFMEFRQSYTSGPYITGWNKQKEYGGGVLYGNEAYFFTMAEFLAGRIRSCTGSASFGPTGTEDQCSVSALMENGSLAVLAVSTNILFKNGLTIYLDKATVEIPDYWKADKAMVFTGGELTDTISCPFTYEFRYELSHYNECILAGKTQSPVTPAENTIRYIGFCEQLYRSWE